MHQPFVRLLVELLEGSSQYLHPVTPIQSRQSRERHLAFGRKVMHGCASGGKVERLRVQVHMSHVLDSVVGSCGEPRGVLARVAEVPNTKVLVIMADVCEQNGS